jgi:hypothetical protein
MQRVNLTKCSDPILVCYDEKKRHATLMDLRAQRKELTRALNAGEISRETPVSLFASP